MNKIRKCSAFITAVLMVCLLVIPRGDAAQYGTNFRYNSVEDMKKDGWILSSDSMIYPSGSGVVLDGTNGQVTLSFMNKYGTIMDWKGGVKGAWLGGSGHSLLGFSVFTENHTYTGVADGASGKYILYRDGTPIVEKTNYPEMVNNYVEIYIEKTGASITLTAGGKAVGSYVEEDPSLVSSISLLSPPSSAAVYCYVGAFIPEPSASGPVDANTALTNLMTEPWETYDPGDLTDINIIIDALIGYQDNPGTVIDPTAIDPASEIPEPALPPQEEEITADVSGHVSNAPLHILMVEGSFVQNTDDAQPNTLGDCITSTVLTQGIGEGSGAVIGSTAEDSLIQNEYQLAASGEINPQYAPAPHTLFGGEPVNYYVQIDTHVSGNFEDPTHETRNGVAIIHATVTDAEGGVAYETEITANGADGKSLAQYHLQIAEQINAFFQKIISGK
jgi:hypothetical protein